MDIIYSCHVDVTGIFREVYYCIVTLNSEFLKGIFANNIALVRETKH